MTSWSDVPNAIRRSDEAIRRRNGRIAENMGMIGGVDPVQAARHDRSAWMVTRIHVVLCRKSRTDRC